jgi:hypothetical protein
LDSQNPFLPGFLRISFFPVFFSYSDEFLLRNVVLEGLEKLLFSAAFTGFVAGIPAGQEFLYLQRIPPDSSGFLFPPKAV